jgi:ADP-ribose pyrophosphatase YjhB (NUDIX family)
MRWRQRRRISEANSAGFWPKPAWRGTMMTVFQTGFPAMSADSPDFFHPAPRAQHFCSQCGTPLVRKVPPGDNRLRDLCEHCGAVHYQNPRMVVGTVPIWQGKVLLCLRAIEPRANTWTLPAGFMELAETLVHGAMRETREEAGAAVELRGLYTVIDIPHVDQVHVYFLADAADATLDPGPESLDARYFAFDEIPWDNLSFRSVSSTLRCLLEDWDKGSFGPHHLLLE